MKLSVFADVWGAQACSRRQLADDTEISFCGFALKNPCPAGCRTEQAGSLRSPIQKSNAT